jgi:outer membrane protein assembly factor BamB
MKRILFSLLILISLSFACIGYNSYVMHQESHKVISSTVSSSLPFTDWTMYHGNPARTGYLPHAHDPQELNPAWSQSLDGAVYAEPLVVGKNVIVATENDTIYSLDAATGKIQWKKNVGTPVPQKDLPCGDIFPLGITGTPVYDPATKLVFAVAEVTGPKHTLFGLDIQTGAIKVQESADIPAMDARAHQQRAALALYKNMVYVAYGGLIGDCSDYIGTVVGLPTSGQGSQISYRIPTQREGGIWAPSGPVIDANGNIYVSVGNGASTGEAWDHSDSVLRFSPTLQLEDGFAPTDWGQQNAADQDLGSMGPVLVSNNQIFADGKANKGYLLNAAKLGGIGGELQQQNICSAFGGAATTGSVAFIPCTNGLLQLTIGQGTMHPGWQAPGNVNGSPIIGGHTVYSVDPSGGVLHALDSQTGQEIAQVNIGGTSRFATPTLSGNFIFIGTMNGISAVTIS